jgi:hypothetical protein
VNLEGFHPFERKVVLLENELRVENIHLELAAVSVSVEVQAQASAVTEHSADADTTLTNRELPALPMAEQRFKEALPLVPGVVRTMNGTLNIKGEVENQGCSWSTRPRWSIRLPAALALVSRLPQSRR